MKTFIIALVTLCLIVTLMVVNYIYLNNVMNKLILLSISVPDYVDPDIESTPEITAMCHFWEKHKFIVSLTVGQKEVDQMDGLIIELICAQRTQDEDAFLKSKSLITEAFTKIKISERLSFEGVL